MPESLRYLKEKVENREIPSNIENWLNERENYFKKRLYEEYHGNISRNRQRIRYELPEGSVLL